MKKSSRPIPTSFLLSITWPICIPDRWGNRTRLTPWPRRRDNWSPNDPSVADTLGWILFRRGEYARALALIEESAPKLAADPEVQFHLGMAHYMMGEEDPARVALQAAVAASKDFPGKEEARRRLAMLALERENGQCQPGG